ncbi:hypothetical protein [Methylobacterium sp. PvR107]|uniref:hypothetical protein n=1 Tax=Methylobacterium sp. PvR107 TaxID=2806597 RepID=UPI001AE51635|nr:hypothetical protein [Methylobacterium sp. PvR107]MBP1178488.1 hypothetical protein [Methylobacterium sp. PvR107]
MIFNRTHLALLWKSWQVEVLSLACSIFEAGALLQTDHGRHPVGWPPRLGRPRARLFDSEAIECVVILVSGLFEATAYINANPDVPKTVLKASEHYLRHGGAEGRGPDLGFDGALYLSHYPDIRSAGINPLLHFIKHGAQEGRLDAVRFDRLPPRAYTSWNQPGQPAARTAEAECIQTILRAHVVPRDDTCLRELRACLDLARSSLAEDLEASLRALQEAELRYYTCNSDYERCMSSNDELMSELARVHDGSRSAAKLLECRDREIEIMSQRLALLSQDISDANQELVYWRRRALAER